MDGDVLNLLDKHSHDKHLLKITSKINSEFWKLNIKLYFLAIQKLVSIHTEFISAVRQILKFFGLAYYFYNELA